MNNKKNNNINIYKDKLECIRLMYGNYTDITYFTDTYDTINNMCISRLVSLYFAGKLNVDLINSKFKYRLSK